MSVNAPARHTPRAKLSRRWLRGLLFLQLITGFVLVIKWMNPSACETRELLGFLAAISILPPPFFLWFLARESSTLYAFAWVVVIRVLGLLFCLAQTFLISGILYAVLLVGAEIHDADVLLITTILLTILSLCTFFSLIAVCLCNPWGRSETNPCPARDPSAKTHFLSARGWIGLLLALAIGGGAACWLYAIKTKPALAPTTLPAGAAEAVKRQEETAKALGVSKELVLDLGNKVTMKLVLIPAGKFMMGSPETEKGRESNEGPQHEVNISKPFFLGVYEVTQEQYEQIIGKNPSILKGAKNPVECVSWNAAVEFCKKLSQKTGRTASLPTEAQWEYACRAGSKTRFSFGDKDEDLHKYGNYCDKSNTDGFPWQDEDHNDGFDKTAPVGSLKANAWGLYDVHGNVWEWCGDWYDSYANAKNQDPMGPDSGSDHVLRGGGWHLNHQGCTSATRSRYPPDGGSDLVGFRVAVDSK